MKTVEAEGGTRKVVTASAVARPLSPLKAAAEAWHIGLLLLLLQGDPLDLLH